MNDFLLGYGALFLLWALILGITIILFLPKLAFYHRWADNFYNRQIFKGVAKYQYTETFLKKLDNEIYKPISDVVIRNERGILVQIDHIIVSRYGVFVIESRNFSGTISGHEKHEFWKQKIGDKVYNIYSPLWQNYSHVMSLQHELGVAVKIIPIVCFSDRSNLCVNAKYSHVVHGNGLLNAVRNHDEEVLTSEQVDDVVKKIQSVSLKGTAIKKERLEQIERAKQEKETQITTKMDKLFPDLDTSVGFEPIKGVIDEPVKIIFSEEKTNVDEIVFGTGKEFIPEPLEIVFGKSASVVTNETVEILCRDMEK